MTKTEDDDEEEPNDIPNGLEVVKLVLEVIVLVVRLLAML
jgi:hypothetical protein